MRIYGDSIIFDNDDWLNYSFGENLREIRRYERMTMKELSIKSNISQSYISQLENDVRLPSDKVILELSKALAKGCDIELFPDDPFGSTPMVDKYEDAFTVESRQQDFERLLRRIKNNDESKNMQKEYLEKVSISNDTEKVEVSKDDLNILKLLNSIDSKQKEFVLDLIKFIKEKN